MKKKRLIAAFFLIIICVMLSSCNNTAGKSFIDKVRLIDLESPDAKAQIYEARQEYLITDRADKQTKEVIKYVLKLDALDAGFFDMLVEAVAEPVNESSVPSIAFAEQYYRSMPASATILTTRHKDLMLLASDYFYILIDSIQSAEDIELMNRAQSYYDLYKSYSYFRGYCMIGKETLDGFFSQNP